MKANGAKKKALREQFEEAAKRHRRNPERMIAEFMRECLEIWEDQQLDEEIARQARRSGYKESDAVALVRKMRRDRTKG